MSRSVRRRVEDAAARFGFGVREVRQYLHRVAGQARNEGWLRAVLICPCGRDKVLHLRVSSLPALSESLEAHLREDGLLT